MNTLKNAHVASIIPIPISIKKLNIYSGTIVVDGILYNYLISLHGSKLSWNINNFRVVSVDEKTGSFHNVDEKETEMVYKEVLKGY